MRPNESEIFKTLLHLQSQPNMSLIFPSVVLGIGVVGDFWNFQLVIFRDHFFPTSKFTIAPYGELKNINYLEKERL